MVRVGIIGTGLVAKEHAKAILMLSGRSTLIAAADFMPERVHDFCSAFRVPREYQTAEHLIADPDVDLVALTTPPATHEALTVMALEAGKYVLCEKPLAHSLAGAVRIAAVADRHPGRLAISHQMRYDLSLRRLIWLTQGDWIGDIQSALVERHSYVPHSDPGKRGWWGSWKIAGGGVLITQLIHELDILLLVMGRPLSVSAEMDTRYTTIESEDFVEATFRFPGGATARCVGSVNSGHLSGRFSIQGTSGTVGLPWNLTMNDPSRLSKALDALDDLLPVPRPASSSIFSRGLRRVARRFGIKDKPELTPHARLYLEILDNIGRGARLPIPPGEALGALELCMAAYQSAIAGTEIKVPLDSSSPFYNGVLKEDYDARRCGRNLSERALVQQ